MATKEMIDRIVQRVIENWHTCVLVVIGIGLVVTLISVDLPTLTPDSQKATNPETQDSQKATNPEPSQPLTIRKILKSIDRGLDKLLDAPLFPEQPRKESE